MNFLEKASLLKTELDSLRPLNSADESRIMQKFRLDWNYHSNNLEGNSLTYGETKALLLFGITAQGKPLKDHFEITGHNEAIEWVLEVIKGERPLTEAFIRELHKLILKEPYQVDAISPDGLPVKKWIKLGEYKSVPNHVKTKTGEIFYFATPEETPAKMNDLLGWYREEIEKEQRNPIIVASLFHYRFIRIHPFDDGNGRTVRILMNFILMQFGYPPVIIKTEEKRDYLSVLEQADAGNIEPFINFIAKNLVQSLELMLKGAKGESIEEPDDLDKQIALLEATIDNSHTKIKSVKSIDTLNVFFKIIFPNLIETFKQINGKFSSFYVQSEYYLQLPVNVIFDEIYYNIYDLKEGNWDLESLIELLADDENTKFNLINLEVKFSVFNRDGFEPFNHSTKLFVKFNKTKFSIYTDIEQKNEKSWFYNEIPTDDQINQLLNNEAKKHLNFIEQKLMK